MASNTIKGLTVEIGGDTTKLGKALDDVNKQSRDLSSELGQINKLLKMDPKNTDLLAQKQKVLADAVSNTKSKLDTLKEAEKQVQAQFERGEVSEAQYRALQREIIETTNKLGGYENALEETNKQIEDIEKKSKKGKKGIKDTGDAAEEADEQTGSFGETLDKVATGGLVALAGAALGAVAALKGIVESTADYRKAMGKLDTAFTTNEHSAEAAQKTYQELQGILGETDQAVEAANHLALLCDTEEELAKWTEIAAGVYGTFGDSLPIEGLTEAANETAKTGQVTGGLADALNWAAQEGETFGVTVKENIEFTKLEKKELDKLTDAQRAEYEAREKQYNEIEEYNKQVEEAATAEDLFNIALSKCTTEQERQQFITETLTKSYGKAAEQYKETNKELIDQNKATEKLNAVWAKVGKKAAPIVTTFTEGIAELVETFLELIEDVDIEDFQNSIRSGFKKISTDVLPKLIDALKWCAEHFDVIKAAATGFIAALAVSKLLNFANTAKTTVVNALKSLTTAQKGANAAANANPYILLASAIIGVATAIGSYLKNRLEEVRNDAYEAALATEGLTEAEIEMTERTKEAAEAFRGQRDAFAETVNGINSQYGYYSTLKDELLRLADAQGKVSEKDQARVNFILGELNEAMGTEYQMIDGQIQGYQTLASEIENVIQKKKAQILLDASSEAYAAALKGRQQAEEDYYNSLALLHEREEKLKEKDLQIAKAKEEHSKTFWPWESAATKERVIALQGERDALQENFDKAKEGYDNSKEMLGGYYSDIGQYETAQLQMLQGNTEEASKILSDRGYYVETYANKVGFESNEVMNTWELEAADAGIKAALIKKNWENGVAGYTEEMVKEAEENYEAAISAMNNAYDDSYEIGGHMTSGIEAGMEQGRSGVISRIKSIISAAVSAAKKEGQIKSPSRKMMQIGEYMGEGLEIGLEDTTDAVAGAAEDQAKRILDAYDTVKELEGRVTMDVTDNREAERQAARDQTLTGKLDSILEAIKSGKILTIDGDALVGATADKYDNKLGQNKLLAARGAK